MIKPFKPMLAVDHDPAKLQFPVIASPKLDGLRGLVRGGTLLSRSLKPIPNLRAQEVLAVAAMEGFDGELIAGDPTDKNCMQACSSLFMAEAKVEDFTFYVFDLHDAAGGYEVRHARLRERVSALNSPFVKLHESRILYCADDLDGYEAECLALGYEGLILRKLDGEYKCGRSTTNEGLLLKVKRFTDGEATVVGFEEQMRNTNAKQVNELGRTKRSSHQDGKVGKGTLGALNVVDCVTGAAFNIGTGMNDELRQKIWDDSDSYFGKIVKYKSFLIGVKELPRHPVFLGWRDPIDMS